MNYDDWKTNYPEDDPTVERAVEQMSIASDEWIACNDPLIKTLYASWLQEMQDTWASHTTADFDETLLPECPIRDLIMEG